jgi:hypothetical protein
VTSPADRERLFGSGPRGDGTAAIIRKAPPGRLRCTRRRFAAELDEEDVESTDEREDIHSAGSPLGGKP